MKKKTETQAQTQKEKAIAMPDAISEIVTEAASAAKAPQRPIVLATPSKDGKTIFKKLEPTQEDLPDDRKDYDGEYYGKELDDELVEKGLFPPIPKKLLGL